MLSYSSSFMAIIYGRRRGSPVLESTPSRTVLVAMPGISGCARLLFAVAQLPMLHGFCPRLQWIKAEASKRSKRACRAARYSTLPDPAERATRIVPRAAYIFEDDTLTVSALAQTRAVPSVPVSPGTGQIRADRFYDESIHAISPCQLVGYEAMGMVILQID